MLCRAELGAIATRDVVRRLEMFSALAVLLLILTGILGIFLITNFFVRVFFTIAVIVLVFAIF